MLHNLSKEQLEKIFIDLAKNSRKNQEIDIDTLY